MYINKIDDLVDKIIDDFSVYINKQPVFSKILSDQNYVKFQSQINSIFSDYITQPEVIKDITEINKEKIQTIYNIIMRYIAYYLFLTIGYYYKNDRPSLNRYINNLIEFTNNQPGYDKFKVVNFFNSESTSNLIKYHSMIGMILILIEDPKHKDPRNQTVLDEANEFISSFDKSFIEQNFKLKNLAGSKSKQAHNLIKTVILNELYYKQDKQDVSVVLFDEEKKEGNYIYINVVVQNKDIIDFNLIENVLSTEDVENGLAYEIDDMLTNYEATNLSQLQLEEMTYDNKILQLINNHIVVPITDDFLLYHKDGEKYEQYIPDSNKKSKRQEQIKIKFIVSKIDKAANLYSDATKHDSKLKESTDKLFYKPLANRKAVLINNSEEIKIINKIWNLGKRAVENQEYYNDLMTYRRYPYINFDDFQKDGFSINMSNSLEHDNLENKVVHAVRYTTYEFERDGSAYLQLRSASADQTIKVVGFLIPNYDRLRNINCLTTRDTMDVRKLIQYNSESESESDISTVKLNNGYAATSQLIQNTIINRSSKVNKSSKSAYWLFDLKTDVITVQDKYEQTTKTSPHENMKMIASTLYDDIMSLVFSYATENVSKRKQIAFYDFIKLIRRLEYRTFVFPKTSVMYINLLRYVFFEKYIKTTGAYDIKEDQFPGLQGKIIKLPVHKFILSKRYKIQELIPTKVVSDEITESGAICQHNLSWDKLTAFRKKNPNRYSLKLDEFIRQYAIIDSEGNFVCKSCETLLDIKQYVRPGEFDDDGRFISYSSTMNINLEEVREYEPIQSAVRYIDKRLERLSEIANIPMYTGSTSQAKARRTVVVKNTIDLINIHNKSMKKEYKNRREQIHTLYGLSNSLTHLFVFELNNSIFIYSSKDKDYYKPIKQNNVLMYLLFTVILEINDTQIMYMGADKICNYLVFEKYGLSLFDGIKILINNKGDVRPIQNYRTLCYMLFYLSCKITKYTMWMQDQTTKDTSPPTKQVTKQFTKFSREVQSTVINTAVDLINSVLEMYSKPTKNHVYNVIGVRFFNKLSTTFSNNDLLKRLLDIERKKIVIIDGKRKYLGDIGKSIYLENYQPFTVYSGTPDWRTCLLVKKYPQLRDFTRERYYEINNVTNCPDGNFHKYPIKGPDKDNEWDTWKKGDKTLRCINCDTTADKLKLDKQLSEKIRQNYSYILIKRTAQKYCQSGQLHNWIIDTNKDCKVCQRCKYIDTDKLSDKDLDTLQDNIIKMNDRYQLKIKMANENLIKKTKLKTSSYLDAIANLKTEFSSSKQHKEDYYGYIERFIAELESVIGVNININNSNSYIRYDTYLIDHDHNGYPRKDLLIIVNRDNKIKFNKDHQFFKRSVIYYTDFKVGRTDVYYDATTHILLGYKEQNREYVLAKKSGQFIKINYSLVNKIKMLGYRSQYIKIDDSVKDLRKYYPEKQDDQLILKEVISQTNHNRIDLLKKILNDIQRILFRIKYNYTDVNKKKEEEKVLDSAVKEESETNYIDRYKKRLQKISIRDPKHKKNKLFKNWKAVQYYLHFRSLKDKSINLNLDSEYLNYQDFYNYDNHGNLILYYIITQLSNLINYNDTDRFIKVSICYLIIDMLSDMHNSINIEDIQTNFELRRFAFLEENSVKDKSVDIEEKGHGLEQGETTGFYGDYKDANDETTPEEIEQRYDDMEEQDAMDATLDENDYEIDYESGVNIS